MKKFIFLAFIIHTGFFLNIFYNQNEISKFKPTPQEIVEEGIYGPNLVAYVYGDPQDESEELKDVQVPIPRKDRVINTKGNCVWCSLELAGRYAEIEKLYNITKNPRDGGDPRCQGASSPSPVRRYLEAEKIKYEMITNGDRNFLVQKCKIERRPVAFGIPGHMLTLVHYDPDTKIVKVIDNADHSLSVQTWSWDKFHKLWDGWSYVIYGEPDIIPYKYFPARKLPIIDMNNPQQKYPEDYIPYPTKY